MTRFCPRPSRSANSRRPAHRLAWVALVGFAASGCGAEAPPPDLPPRAIQWERVSGDAAGERRVISGIVLAISDTELAFDVGGIVETVDVNLGDRVERGQVLARLDPEPFELSVRDAEAALAEATALHEAARADAERTRRLFDAMVASRQELDRDVARRDSTASQVEAARARLNLASRDLRRSVLRAPFEGDISVRTIDRAMKVASGQTVFEMDSGESGLRVEVQMPETLIARVDQGLEVDVSFPSIAADEADEASFEAVVTEVGTRAGAANAFPVRADLADPPPGLRPGMTAEVTFVMASDPSQIVSLEGFLIPISAALAEPEDRFSVFIFDPASSTVSRREIQPGGVRGNRLAVLAGLEEGEVVATAGVSFLRDGQTVTLLDEQQMRRRR